MLIDAANPTYTVDQSVSEVGDKILGRLSELGLSQRDLADTIGFHEQTVSNWVRGVQLPRQRRAQVELAKRLGGRPEDWAPTVSDRLEMARRYADKLRREADTN